MTFSDEELLKQTLAARRRAHNAPLATYHEDHDGHKWVEGATTWGTASLAWSELADEVDRRGLPQPIPDWDGDSRRGLKKEAGHAD